MFEIKNAGIDDIPLIRELTFRVWPQTYASILSQEQIDYMLDMMYSEASLKKQIAEMVAGLLLCMKTETRSALLPIMKKKHEDGN